MFAAAGMRVSEGVRLCGEGLFKEAIEFDFECLQETPVILRSVRLYR